MVATNRVPPVEVAPRTMEKLDEMQWIQWTRMLAEQRKEMLFQQLDSSGLEGWPIENWAATQALLAEYYDIFSLDLKRWVVLAWWSIILDLLMNIPLKRD